jgi:hypothetical protein
MCKRECKLQGVIRRSVQDINCCVVCGIGDGGPRALACRCATSIGSSLLFTHKRGRNSNSGRSGEINLERCNSCARSINSVGPLVRERVRNCYRAVRKLQGFATGDYRRTPNYRLPPLRPPLRLADRFSLWPRPLPDFLPPPDSLFTVAHARALAVFADTPRFSYPSAMCSARRFCLPVYALLLPLAISQPPCVLSFNHVLL